MSTLSIPSTQDSETRGHESDVDTRFDALVRFVVPAQRAPHAEVDFETVFDLDYGQPAESPQPVVAPVRLLRRVRRVRRQARQVRQVQPAPQRTAPRTVRLTRRGRVVLVLGFLALALALMIPL